QAAVDQLVDAGLLDELMSQVDAGELQLTGEGGFLPGLIKAVLERGLAAELTGHLGYEKGDPAGRGSPNSRNGSTPKTISTEVGDVDLATPRDRAGTFEPRLVPKGARRVGWASPRSVEASPMRRCHARDEKEVRSGVPRGRGADRS